MTDLDLAKRAVACKGWRWMPGMRLFGGATVTYADDFIDIVLTGDATVRRWGGVGAGPLLPDLTDPATRGCLLQLVREAWGNPHMYLSPLERSSMTVEWRAVWMVPPGELGGYKAWDGPTETAALIAALEAAPERKQ